MQFARLLVAAAAGLLLAGCGGGPKYVKVSGVVTVNGKPYPKAVVSFQPIATKDNPEPGPGSGGDTDENGRFTLMTHTGISGAVIGKHRVRIVTRRDNPNANYDPEVGSPDNEPGPEAGPRTIRDPIPAEWSSNSTKEFDVPPGGTDQANFDIVNKAPEKKK